MGAFSLTSVWTWHWTKAEQMNARLFSSLLADMFPGMIPAHRCTGHTLIERIIFLTLGVICKSFCEEHNCSNHLRGDVFIKFLKIKQCWSRGYLYYPPSTFFWGNKWKTTAYSSMRLRPLKTKELGSVSRKTRSVLFLPSFILTPWQIVMCWSMSGGPLQRLVEIRGGPETAYRLSQPGEVHPKCPLYVLL